MIDRVKRYGIKISLGLPPEDAIERTKAALSDEGFGILTEADVSATLKNKLGVDFPRYVILGACNPALAHRALTAEPDIGLLLPCNVIVYSDGRGGSIVAAMDPEAALALAENPAIAEVAGEVGARLERVLLRLSRDGQEA